MRFLESVFCGWICSCPPKVCDQLPRRLGCPIVLDFAVYRNEKVIFWPPAESVEMAGVAVCVDALTFSVRDLLSHARMRIFCFGVG